MSNRAQLEKSIEPVFNASVPDDIRAKGWMVAVHNDYRQNGKNYTFWLFTKDDRAVKGEGETDAEALQHVRHAIFAQAVQRGEIKFPDFNVTIQTQPPSFSMTRVDVETVGISTAGIVDKAACWPTDYKCPVCGKNEKHEYFTRDVIPLNLNNRPFYVPRFMDDALIPCPTCNSITCHNDTHRIINPVGVGHVCPLCNNSFEVLYTQADPMVEHKDVRYNVEKAKYVIPCPIHNKTPIDCPMCQGQGTIDKHACYTCAGSGRVLVNNNPHDISKFIDMRRRGQ